MEIEDLSWSRLESKRTNSPLLPKSIRGLIVGHSQCGKTTLLLNLLLKPGCLDYDNLSVYGKSLFQDEYEILKKALEERLPKEGVLELFRNCDEIVDSGIDTDELIKEWCRELGDGKKSETTCNFFEDGEEVPDPRELNRENKNVMVFDDLLLQKQNKCECYYTRGRHSNVDSFYLCQNYFKIPRQTIRENANLICMFHQNPKNVNHIYQDHVGGICLKRSLENFVVGSG